MRYMVEKILKKGLSKFTEGKLYICPTPIGNLEDITLRTLRILKEVDIIAAEDTRHSIKLLRHFEIQKPLISYHEHNEQVRSKELIKKLLNGKKIALISDAGMPGISDPGEVLIKKCIDKNIPIEVLPGATAGIMALIGSGLDTRRFAFEGFLPRDKKGRKDRLKEIELEDRTLIIYESPHRLNNTLKDMLDILGNRNIVIARELTKKYEEFIRGNIEDIYEKVKKNPIKGELVLICDGVSKEEIRNKEQEKFHDISIKDHILLFMQSGISKKDAIKEVAKIRKIPKSQVYKEAIDL